MPGMRILPSPIPTAAEYIRALKLVSGRLILVSALGVFTFRNYDSGKFTGA